MTPYIIHKFDTKDDWLKAKNKVDVDNFTISSTEAATVLEVNPFQTKAELYDIKLGLKRKPDISSKACVQYGVASEELIRQQAMIDLPYFDLDYKPYDIYQSKQYPFMVATLDGFLTINTPNNPWGFDVGDVGVLEVKTSQIRSKKYLDDVMQNIPINYYCQMIHAAKIVGAKFVINPCRYKWDPYKEEHKGLPSIYCCYHIIDCRDTEVIEDQRTLITAEEKFINENLKKQIRPAIKLAI